MEGLHIVKGILPALNDNSTGKILSAVNPLLVSGGLDLRSCICDILDGLSVIDPSLAFLVIIASYLMSFLLLQKTTFYSNVFATVASNISYLLVLCAGQTAM